MRVRLLYIKSKILKVLKLSGYLALVEIFLIKQILEVLIMKAMYLKEPGTIVEKDIPKPDINEEGLLVEIKQVGVCGSDIEYYETGKIGEFVVEEPLILGHESAGVVADVGEKVENFETGDKVALEPGIPCRKCKHCKEGKYNLCPNVNFMATPPIDGTFTEYFAQPADFAYRLPDSISLEEGALMEPLSVGIHAARRGNVDLGDSVAVLGAGPIGLVTMQSAFAAGASKVIITDIVDFRLEKAKDLGATDAINVQKDDLKDLYGEFDKVLQTAGTSDTYEEAMHLVDRGGKVVQVGTPSADELNIDPNEPITREFDILGAFRYANTYQDAINLVHSDTISLKPLISKTFPLEETEEALIYSSENPEKSIKTMVEIS
ncbi:NAD(P)-dependent alcohol dehydrogenase [Candidatus Bipolaricaulota bacterium]|nr:NAD(P)-dependent alcohol dehydrogenase [Candidatus Bipolaricaulota bacterium]